MPVRILVVDDAATIRDVCAELIRDLGYEVNVVADAAEALVRLREERFHAMVTDIVMPGMDGWQLIAAVIHEQPMLRLVAMTGADVEGDRERAVALGVPPAQAFHACGTARRVARGAHAVRTILIARMAFLHISTDSRNDRDALPPRPSAVSPGGSVRMS